MSARLCGISLTSIATKRWPVTTVRNQGRFFSKLISIPTIFTCTFTGLEQSFAPKAKHCTVESMQSVKSAFHRSTDNTFRHGKMASLESLNFDNLVLRSLPIDSSNEIQPRQVKGACFSKMKLSLLADPATVAVSSSALGLLDLDEEQSQRDDFPEYFGGNKLLPGSQLAAHCYCGHQFGHFSGQLGDGAAM